MKCDAHGEEYSAVCNWCGTKVCDACIDEANGKKYCTNCNDKVAKTPRVGEDEASWGIAPSKKISNVDDSLNESTIKQARQMLNRRGY